MHMKSWFWPGVTSTAALTALALWFGTAAVENDIANRVSHVLSPYVWTGFDVEGRDVTVKGIAPDPSVQAQALSALKNVTGINDITDLTSVLPLASPYMFRIEKRDGGLIFSGSIPDNALRDPIMERAETMGPDLTLDDQMALARGAGPDFADSVQFLLGLTKNLAEGQVEIVDKSLSIKGKAGSSQAYQELTQTLEKPLPYDLTLTSSDMMEP